MRHDDPVADTALDWFLRLRDGAGDPEVQRAFEDWLRQDPGIRPRSGRSAPCGTAPILVAP